MKTKEEIEECISFKKMLLENIKSKESRKYHKDHISILEWVLA